MRHSGRRPALVALALHAVVGLILQCCLGEVLFHRRDHRDQGEFSPAQTIFTVRTDEDALLYLNKYGYLNCTVERERRDTATNVDELAQEGSVRKAECSQDEIEKAFKKLQVKLNLEPTGRLDEDTKRTMSKGRCGNSDVKDMPPGTLQDAMNRVSTERQRTGEPTPTPTPSGVSPPSLPPSQPPSPPSSAPSSPALPPVVPSAPAPPQMPSSPAPPPGGSSTPGTRVRRRALGIIAREQTQQERELARLRKENAHKSLLHRLVEAKSHVPGTSWKRREQQLSEIIERIKAGSDADPDLSPEERKTVERMREQGGALRRKRSIQAEEGLPDTVLPDSTTDTQKLARDETKPVTWRILADGISGKIPVADQKGTIKLAFRMWGEVIPLRFHETNEVQDAQKVDILMAFGKQWHLNCMKPFDGHGGELAHSWTGGDIHFDEDENYRRDDLNGNGINLLKVAVHEIGHVLGLWHNDKNHSIMYPIYNRPVMYEDFELGKEDRKDIQDIYGCCKGQFDIVFDWLRKVKQPGDHMYSYIFNTYFFRDDRYWMYENRWNRTRYGDPLIINLEWKGLPSKIDAYVQTAQRLQPGMADFDIKTYFFKDDQYYRYDDGGDQVAEGYPRLISEDFGHVNCTENIPNNLDAAWLDYRDNLLYFFKNTWVWVFDPKKIGSGGCPERKVLFTELFPMAAGETRTLTGNVRTVYHSYHQVTTYVFQDEHVYENVGIATGKKGLNLLKYIGPWYSIWFDICDVE